MSDRAAKTKGGKEKNKNEVEHHRFIALDMKVANGPRRRNGQWMIFG